MRLNFFVVLRQFGQHNKRRSRGRGVGDQEKALLMRFLQDIVDGSWKIVHSNFVERIVPKVCIVIRVHLLMFATISIPSYV